jgi:hypothetical protein
MRYNWTQAGPLIGVRESEIFMENKVTGQLLEQSQKPEPSSMLDIVIELRPPDESAAKSGQSRSEKIAALKANFTRDLVPIEQAVRSLGGELTGEAWINRTVRARIPSRSLKKLSEQELIAKLDIPHRLEPERS